MCVELPSSHWYRSSSIPTFGYAAASATACLLIAFCTCFTKMSGKGEKWKFHQFRTIKNKVKNPHTFNLNQTLFTWIVQLCVYLWRERKTHYLKCWKIYLRNQMKPHKYICKCSKLFVHLIFIMYWVALVEYVIEILINISLTYLSPGELLIIICTCWFSFFQKSVTY